MCQNGQVNSKKYIKSQNGQINKTCQHGQVNNGIK